MLPSHIRPFNNARYLRCPVFSVQEGLSVARALCARCPKVLPALVKRAKDNLQRVAAEAQTALDARSRQSGLISEEDSNILDSDMHRAWTAMLMRLDAYAMLPPDKYPQAGRSDELLTQLFYSEGSDFLKDTYSAQLAAMQRMLQRIEEDQLEEELNELCSPPFLAWIRALLPRYQNIVHAMLSRDGEPLVNLLVHRNALSRAVVTYATAICLTVNDNDHETVKQALSALQPLAAQSTVRAGHCRPGVGTSELTLTWSAAEAPLPA